MSVEFKVKAEVSDNSEYILPHQLITHQKQEQQLHDVSPQVKNIKEEKVNTLPGKPQLKHECLECGKTFHYQSALRGHEAVHTGVPAYNSQQYKCHHCQKAFVQKYLLQSHVKCVHGNFDLPHRCGVCGKTFKFKYERDEHVKGVHSLNEHARLYQCKLCDKKFTGSGTLLVHVKSVHEKLRYSCDVCSKTFSSKGNLVQHKLVHSG